MAQIIKKIQVKINEKQFKKFGGNREKFNKYLTKRGIDVNKKVKNITPPRKRYVLLEQEVIVDEEKA